MELKNTRKRSKGSPCRVLFAMLTRDCPGIRVQPSILIHMAFGYGGILLRRILIMAVMTMSLRNGSAQAPAVMSNSNQTQLRNHVPAFVRTAPDEGVTSGTVLIRNVEVLLTRSPDQQRELQNLIKEQADDSSTFFRRWLTPEEFAARFGASSTNIDAICTWLRSFGLVPTVSRSKSYISVAGNAAQLSEAFGTNFHTFLVGGQFVNALTIEPSVPTGIAPYISSISGLSQYPEQPKRGSVDSRRNSVRSDETTTNGHHVITPADFAVIYDIAPLNRAGYTGTGQSIAIVGRSRVLNADVQNFAAFSNVVMPNPQVVLPPGSTDPGETNDDDQNEATLDVTRAASVAPGATIFLVINAKSNGGEELAMKYVIDNQLAPIMSVSFSYCELNLGKANTEFYNALFTQGAAEGITTFVSAGDGGVDACEAADSVPLATQANTINGFCASPNVTCVGGTEFIDTADASAYWNSSNGTGHESAIGYIPEGVFNDPVNLSTNAFQIFAGGGGLSAYIPAPGWQSTIPIDTGEFRAVPDISFSSSGHDGYLVCLAYEGYPCVPDAQGTIEIHSVAGTSAAAPSMAGIQALLDQQENGPLGNINPMLYSLASDPSNGIFHDVTIASSGVTNCSPSIPSLCNNSTPSANSLSGGEPGYVAASGYDLATGWGSMDIYKLFQHWSSAPKLNSAVVDLILSDTLVSAGQSLTFSVSMLPKSPAPTGTIQFLLNGQTLGSPIELTAGNAAITTTVIGTTQSNSVQAVYSGDGSYNPAVSGSMQFVISPIGSPAFTVSATPITIAGVGQSSTSFITVSPTNGFTGTVTLSCISTAGVTLGSCAFTPASLTINGTPAQSVLTLTSVSPSARPGPTSHLSEAMNARRPPPIAEGLAFGVLIGLLTAPKSLRKKLPASALLCILGLFLIACGRSQTTVTIASALNPGKTQEAISFQAIVAGPAGSTPPTGSVQFLSNGQTIGSPVKLSNGVATFSQTFTSAGTYSIVAEYLGSSSAGSSSSSPLSETITFKNPGTQPGNYSLLVQATTGKASQTIPVSVTVQ